MPGGWTYYPASTLPALYDIVWCHFPEHHALDQPSPKGRPALIVKTATEDNDEKPQIRAVYGTSNLKIGKRPLDFYVRGKLAELDICGLFQTTRFDMDRRLWVPWAEEFFACPSPDYQTPVMGHLSPNAMKRLINVVIARHNKGLD